MMVHCNNFNLLLRCRLLTSVFGGHEHQSGEYNKREYKKSVANVVPALVDDVGDQERMVLLPEEVGEKGFLELIPLCSEIDSSRKRHVGGPLLGSRLKAGGRNVLWM
ncbi:hypothetical protein TNCV_4852251 [Trichonephila clavipes]|nr:hypothetical protein TNCV_4852251 [Trichonephila clavipes]